MIESLLKERHGEPATEGRVTGPGGKIVAWLAALCAFGVLATPAPPALAARTAYVANLFSNNVSAYSIAADGSLSPLAESPFATGGIAPVGVTMTPDGEHLYVSNIESDTVSAYSIASDGSLSPVTGSPFATGVWPWGVAVSPDGEHLYVANDGSTNVSAYSIASDGSLSPVAGSPFLAWSAASKDVGPNGVAVTPDGRYLYVTDQGAHSVWGFSIAPDGSLSPLAGVPFEAGSTPRAVSVTPDDKYLYVVNESSGDISAYSISSDGSLSEVADSPFATEGAPLGIAVTPDGSHLYVAHVAGSNNAWAYSISSDGSLSPVAGSPFATGGLRGNSAAVSPDGKRLYVTNNASDNVSAFSVASNGSLSRVAGSPFATGSGPLQVAVTPDQGPVAAFSATPTPSGDPSSFDASASSDPDGTVASYEWDFGDGQTEATPTATTTHAYVAAGEYTVALTVTDDAGCSTAQTFTGQTAGCNGSSPAWVSHQVTVSPGVSLSVSLAGSGSGSVTSSPSGIACPEACSYAYLPEAKVTLNASPAPGSTFDGWSGGGCAGTGACQVTLNADADVTATFSELPPQPPLDTLAVRLAGSGAGSVTTAQAKISCPPTCAHAYAAGARVALAAAPAPGSRFAGWSGGGCVYTRACELTIGADTTLTASFEKIRRGPRLRIRHVCLRAVPLWCATGAASSVRSRNLHRARLRIGVGGTIARRARGVVMVKVSAYLPGRRHGRRTTATKRTRIVHGRWCARLMFPRVGRRPKATINVTARFNGSLDVQRGHAKRHVRLK